MKSVKLFIQSSCPYCKQALRWMDELKKENEAYSKIDIEIIDELVNPTLANSFDYYYVPTYYVDGAKVHEGIATKEKIRSIYESALK